MTRLSLLSLTALALLLVVQSCSFTTANIERAVFSRQINPETREPLDETTSYHGSDALLHCSVLMANSPTGTVVKAKWYAKIEEKRKSVVCK